MLKKLSHQQMAWAIGLLSAVYGIVVLYINETFFPLLTIPLFSADVWIIVGFCLIIAGLPVYLIPAFTIGKYIKEKKLATGGIYAYFRHPMYASWILFFVPGIVLQLNLLLGLTIPIFMHFMFEVVIVEEEKHLADKFGEEFKSYKNKTGSIFPKLFK